jgi:hypothetical protein
VTESGQLTRRQRWIVAVLTVAIAATRIYALSRSLWDWDEALFSVGVRSYDVTQHHPHPPGFPLFIAAAKLVHLAIHDEFRAVQAVTLLGAIGLFPALFALARALCFPFVVAAGGAAIYAFFPAVWVFGGTAFSDVPSTTLVLVACTFLLRGVHDRRAYLAGAVLLGISAGFRSQNLLIGCAPALYATWARIRVRAWGEIAAAIALGAAIVAVSYAGAAYASSDPPRGYLGSMANLRAYVRHVDSFMNPGRPPLRALVFDYFVHPIRSGRFDYVVLAFAAVGFATTLRRFGMLMALAMFLPFQLFAWLMLDPLSVSRYGTAYLPLYALLAAAGAHAIAFFWIDVAIVAAIVARLFVWTLPAVREIRSGESPPAAAMREIVRRHPQQSVFVHMSMSPFADEYLASTPTTVILKENELPLEPRDALYVCECVRPGHVYERPRGALWNIVRRRYFDVTLTTLGQVWRFRDGWHDEEGEGSVVFRWMKARSVTILPAVGPRARLTLAFGIPSQLVAAVPTLTVTLNGRAIDRVRCTTEVISKSWDVDANPNAPNELVLSIDRVVNPLREHIGGDARDLGLRLDRYELRAR